MLPLKEVPWLVNMMLKNRDQECSWNSACCIANVMLERFGLKDFRFEAGLETDPESQVQEFLHYLDRRIVKEGLSS